MYRYSDLIYDLNGLIALGASVSVIGFSLEGRPIYCVHTGGLGKQLIVTASIHARENLTARLVMLQAMHSLINESKLGEGGIYYIPMLNPDGVVKVERGCPFWKANANSVDLNVNFDARFSTGLSNTNVAGGENYVGEYPFSENETRAIRDFTLKTQPAATISYHAKGREIYYEFYQQGENLKRDRELAEFISKKLRYKLIEGTRGSAGGYKDWCIQALKIPSFTIEIIDDKFTHPLSDLALLADIDRNVDLPEKLLKKLYQEC